MKRKAWFVNMKIFGYQKDNDTLLGLEEVSLQCTIEELEKVIKFLMEAWEQHTKVYGKTDNCHSHFRDWDDGWKNGDPDLIVVTKFMD